MCEFSETFGQQTHYPKHWIYIYIKTKGKQIVQRAQQLTSGNVNGGKKAVKVWIGLMNNNGPAACDKKQKRIIRVMCSDKY